MSQDASGTGSVAGRPLVGVLGGVGPQATVLFLDRVVHLTRAERDQDHVDLVVTQRPSVPDRTAFLLDPDRAEDPRPALIRDARLLERAGVSRIVLPCNSADAFRTDVAAAVGVPLESIVQRAVAACASARTIGVLATDGTLEAGTYRHEIAATGQDMRRPTEADQALVMHLIYDQVKAGRPADGDLLRGLVTRLRESGAERVVLGCTELSVAAAEHGLTRDEDLGVVDSTEVLARDTVVWAGGRLRGDG